MRRAVICLDGWAGRTEHPCQIVGETKHRYRVKVDKPENLPDWLRKQTITQLVPKHAVRLIAEGEGAN